MKKLLIEDIKVGVSAGGMACGPVPGHVVAEIRLRDMEDGTVTYHSAAEVEGMPIFFKTSVSTFDTQINDSSADEEAWDVVMDGEDGNYDSYYAFYEDMENCDETHKLILKYLAYLVCADWDETERFKAETLGKCLGDFEIPISEEEQEYLDEKEDDGDIAEEPFDEN